MYNLWFGRLPGHREMKNSGRELQEKEDFAEFSYENKKDNRVSK